MRGSSPRMTKEKTVMRFASALESLAGELVEIVLPVGGAVTAELVQVVPAEDAGRVQIVEHEPHCIIADRLDLEDRDVLLAADGLAFLRRVTLHLRAGATNAQILGAEVEGLAGVEGNRQRPAILVQSQFGRPWLLRVARHIEAPA